MVGLPIGYYRGEDFPAGAGTREESPPIRETGKEVPWLLLFCCSPIASYCNLVRELGTCQR